MLCSLGLQAKVLTHKSSVRSNSQENHGELNSAAVTKSAHLTLTTEYQSPDIAQTQCSTEPSHPLTSLSDTKSTPTHVGMTNDPQGQSTLFPPTEVEALH